MLSQVRLSFAIAIAAQITCEAVRYITLPLGLLYKSLHMESIVCSNGEEHWTRKSCSDK
jgi:hypothetical protein